jgi:hypothetical protein
MLLQDAQTYLIIQISIFLALMLVYGVFLCYKLLKRKEHLEYLAYLAATIPFAYLWMAGFDYLGAILVLVVLWTVALGRDLIDRYGPKPKEGRKNEADFAVSIGLYAAAAGVFFLFSAIVPLANKALVETVTHPDIQQWFVFYLPTIDEYFNLPIRANPFFTPFRFLLTVDIIMMTIPMLHEIKISNVKTPVGPNLFLAILFALPSTYAVYTWVAIPLAMVPVGLIFGILYFVALLSFTKGKVVKKKPVS